MVWHWKDGENKNIGEQCQASVVDNKASSFFQLEKLVLF